MVVALATTALWMKMMVLVRWIGVLVFLRLRCWWLFLR